MTFSTTEFNNMHSYTQELEDAQNYTTGSKNEYVLFGINHSSKSMFFNNYFNFDEGYEPGYGPIFENLQLFLPFNIDLNLIVLEYIVLDNYIVCNLDKCLSIYNQEFQEFVCEECKDREEMERQQEEYRLFLIDSYDNNDNYL